MRRSVHFLSVVVLCFALLFGTTAFAQPETYTVVSYALQLPGDELVAGCIGDFDADGMLEIAGFLPGTVIVRDILTGNAEFVSDPVVEDPIGFSVSDLDGDLTPELIVEFPSALWIVDGTVTVSVPGSTFEPSRHELGLARPNPTSARSTIDFELVSTAEASVRVFDAQGRLVRTLVDARLPQGRHSFDWDNRDSSGHQVSAGTYFFRVLADDQEVGTTKSVVVR